MLPCQKCFTVISKVLKFYHQDIHICGFIYRNWMKRLRWKTNAFSSKMLQNWQEQPTFVKKKTKSKRRNVIYIIEYGVSCAFAAVVCVCWYIGCYSIFQEHLSILRYDLINICMFVCVCVYVDHTVYLHGWLYFSYKFSSCNFLLSLFHSHFSFLFLLPFLCLIGISIWVTYLNSY